MITKGIRGAITVDSNTEIAIKNATLELLNELIKKNNIVKEQLSHVFFSVTNDLNAEFPAKFARVDLGWDDVAMMCFNELTTQNSLKMCLRVMLIVNCDENFIPKYVYLKGSKNLRS